MEKINSPSPRHSLGTEESRRRRNRYYGNEACFTTLMDLIPEKDSDSSENLSEEPLDKSPLKSKMPFSNPMDMLKNILQVHGRSDMENANMPVLDSHHPLMLKYQNDLKQHLLKLHQETDEQVYELNCAIRDQAKENDQIGKHNCDLQKELLRCKENVNKLNEEFDKIAETKKHLTKKVDAVRESHKTSNAALEEERNKEMQLQKQIEELALQIVQLRELETGFSSDSSTLKCAVEKTTKLREDLEIEKLRQDLLITRLEADKYNICDKISLYKSQCAIKKEEITDLKKILADASAEMQTIHLEKKKMLQQWKHSITALEKRDETLAIMQENVRKYEDEMRTLNMDITNHKKHVRKELEQNEQLTLQLLQNQSDTGHIRKHVEDCKTRQIDLEENHAFFERVVHSTDVELENLKNEKASKEKELETKAKQLEKAYIVQKAMEEEYLKILHDKITLTKASQSTEKLIKELRKRIEKLQAKCILKEGEKAKLELQMSNIKAHLSSMDEELVILQTELAEKEKTIHKSELETVKSHTLIEKKQTVLSDLNTRLVNLVASAGGQELGPLEREIASFKKDIVEVETVRETMEQEWLQCQKKLVALTNDVTEKYNEIEALHDKERVLEERKIRLEADINKEEYEIAELLCSIDHTRKDISRITSLLYHENEQEQKLQQDSESLKGSFINALKDAEINFLKKENEVESLRKERTRLIYALAEAQKGAVLCEEKIHLAEEAKKLLKSESHADEIANLNSEIRRLQVKCDKIKRDEETLTSMLTKAAFQHANLYVKADIQLLRSSKKPSKQYFITKTERLKKKIKEDKKKLEDIKKEIELKVKTVSEFKEQEKDQQNQLTSLMDEIKLVDYDTDNKQRQKWQDVIQLSLKQKRNKLLQLVKNEKYVRAIRNANLRAVEIERLQANLSVLQEITEQIISSHPNLESNLVKVLDHVLVGLKM